MARRLQSSWQSFQLWSEVTACLKLMNLTAGHTEIKPFTTVYRGGEGGCVCVRVCVWGGGGFTTATYSTQHWTEGTSLHVVQFHADSTFAQDSTRITLFSGNHCGCAVWTCMPSRPTPPWPSLWNFDKRQEGRHDWAPFVFSQSWPGTFNCGSITFLHG